MLDESRVQTRNEVQLGVLLHPAQNLTSKMTTKDQKKEKYGIT